MSTPADASPRKLKVLMLHGYTQSGRSFHFKTRSLEKLLQKTFPAAASVTPKSVGKPLKDYPGGIQLIYPTGPIYLRPADIPGYRPDPNADANADPEDTDAWGWWKHKDNTGIFEGLELGLATIATAIREAGGIDGIIGFSQGAAAATFVASLLDEGRLKWWNEYLETHPEATLPYPSSFLMTPADSPDFNEKEPPRPFHPPLKFTVSYSGFYAPNPSYAPFYNPKIQTKMLHFIGTLDTIVEESRSLDSARACVGWGGEDGKGEKGNVQYHPGGHFLPVAKEMAGVLIGFIKEVFVEEEGKKGEKKEVKAEDMDVPF